MNWKTVILLVLMFLFGTVEIIFSRELTRSILKISAWVNGNPDQEHTRGYYIWGVFIAILQGIGIIGFSIFLGYEMIIGKFLI